MENIYEELFEKAKKASENAYCPYSKFPVGASILYESNNIYTGCNVENVSFGLTLCAERNAMAAAVSAGEKTGIKAIAIYSPKQKECMPCGACRQWLNEFASNEELKIILEGENELTILTLKEIFPHGFKFN
ncbi:MAG: cytidine deaminase [Candidatus Gastranaerophilales bacterium]|nr:cytidine deaminase [Candidatus Gastranaerophilales bacterium]